MTQELINTIKVHAWTKSELKEIKDFCVTAINDDDCIDDEDVQDREDLEWGETIQ